MKLIKFGLLLGMLLVAGCDPPTVQENSEAVVGIINGKPLHRIIVSGDGNSHYVYFFPTDPQQPISNNMRIGKSRTVVVFIDGKPVSTNVVFLETPTR